MFCPGTATLADGKIMVTGGSSNKATTIYDSRRNTWSNGSELKIARGYHSMTVMGDGSVFALGGSWGSPGGNKDGEVWSPRDKKWHEKRGIRVDEFLTKANQDYHMWLFQAPNGKLFHAGPSRQMHWIQTGGNGNIQNSLFRGDRDTMNGNAVMFDIGKILTIGGSPDYSDSDATNQVHVVDINGREAQVSRTGNMAFRRAMMNGVVLPTGDVVVIGGMPKGKHSLVVFLHCLQPQPSNHN